jgi:hypothetical protein
MSDCDAFSQCYSSANPFVNLLDRQFLAEISFTA